MSEHKGIMARLLNEYRMQPGSARRGGPWVPPEPMSLRLPMMCSANGGWITLLAEEQDTVLRVVGYEIPQTEQAGGGSPQPRLLSGEHRIEFPRRWACPLCTNNSWFVCHCANLFGALHCQGNIGGKYHCACGGSANAIPLRQKKFRCAA